MRARSLVCARFIAHISLQRQYLASKQPLLSDIKNSGETIFRASRSHSFAAILTAAMPGMLLRLGYIDCLALQTRCARIKHSLPYDTNRSLLFVTACGTDTVDMQIMVCHFITFLSCHFALTFFDNIINKLFHLPTGNT